ncbi:hypothetical protein PQR33_36095 [Paraburkholderia sediminicola]|uniref:hypothetical protein n=1 Tax=Paraburkholderia sediminicola TaxID=458836 RepID=UPI0038B73EC1
MKTTEAAERGRDQARVFLCVACLALLFLAGCCTGGIPQATAIDAGQIGAVQTEVKRQVGDYLLYIHHERDNATAANASGDAACAKNTIDFQIDSLLLDLHTTLTDDTTGNAGIKIPVGAVGSVGPAVSGGHKTENSQQIQFHEYPAPDGYYKSFFARQAFEKAQSGKDLSTLLIALHKGLLAARSSAPCLSGIDYAATGQKNVNSYVIGLTVTDNGKAGVDISLGPVTFGVAHEHTVINNNSLTVTFRQIDLAALPEVKSTSHTVPKLVLFGGQINITGLLKGLNSNPVATGSSQDPTEASNRAYTLCRDAEFFTYWCVNGTEKVPF